MKPIQWDKANESLEDFRKKLDIDAEIDKYDELLEDLFLIRNPRFKFEPSYKKELEEFINEHKGEKSLEEAGEWFYFPWNNILMHYLPDEMHQEIRTARNKNIITKDEQEKFYNHIIAIVSRHYNRYAEFFCLNAQSYLHLQVI